MTELPKRKLLIQKLYKAVETGRKKRAKILAKALNVGYEVFL